VEEWIKANFTVSIDNEGVERFKVSSLPEQWAVLSWFVSVFGRVTVPPTAAILKAVDPDNVTGWHSIFDKWASDGLISEV